VLSKIRGVVVSGIGEAGFYVKLYSEYFRELLEREPYPGTLNILLESCSTLEEIFSEKHLVKPLKPGLAPAYIRRGVLRGFSVVVVKPLVTRHECRVLEVVSSVKLRDVLGLRDGDVVEIELH
jgi:riboflavin kinase